MKAVGGKYISEVIFLMVLCVIINDISSRSDSVLDSIVSISCKLAIIVLLFRLYKKVKNHKDEYDGD
jgi:hypothetical protein